MTDCHELIDNFLKSTNEVFKINYKNPNKVDVNYVIGQYKNFQCIMSKNDFDKLSKNNKNYKEITYGNTIYLENWEFITPTITILTSK
jgi:hypothetical protein